MFYLQKQSPTNPYRTNKNHQQSPKKELLHTTIIYKNIYAHPGTQKPNISPKTLAGNGYQEAEPVQIKALEGFKVPTDPEIGRMLSFFVFEIPMC